MTNVQRRRRCGDYDHDNDNDNDNDNSITLWSEFFDRAFPLEAEDDEYSSDFNQGNWSDESHSSDSEVDADVDATEVQSILDDTPSDIYQSHHSEPSRCNKRRSLRLASMSTSRSRSSSANPPPSSAPRSSTTNEFLCPITKDIMCDPVVASDGHTYERVAITEWLQRGRLSSPITNQPIPSTVLLPNHAMWKMICEKHPHMAANNNLLSRRRSTSDALHDPKYDASATEVNGNEENINNNTHPPTTTPGATTTTATTPRLSVTGTSFGVVLLFVWVVVTSLLFVYIDDSVDVAHSVLNNTTYSDLAEVVLQKNMSAAALVRYVQSEPRNIISVLEICSAANASLEHCAGFTSELITARHNFSDNIFAQSLRHDFKHTAILSAFRLSVLDPRTYLVAQWQWPLLGRAFGPNGDGPSGCLGVFTWIVFPETVIIFGSQSLELLRHLPVLWFCWSFVLVLRVCSTCVYLVDHRNGVVLFARTRFRLSRKRVLVFALWACGAMATMWVMVVLVSIVVFVVAWLTTALMWWLLPRAVTWYLAQYYIYWGLAWLPVNHFAQSHLHPGFREVLQWHARNRPF